MEIVKRVITEKNYDKDGKVVSEKTTEEHFKEKIDIIEEFLENSCCYRLRHELDKNRLNNIIPW